MSFDVTSKLEKLVWCRSASDYERISKPNIYFHMVWNAHYQIYKTVKTDFLCNVLLKSDWLVNKDHFPCCLIWRQNLKIWCCVVPLLTMNGYQTLIYDFIWSEMPVTQSTRLWKPFFSSMLYWKVIGGLIRTISRVIWCGVETWKIGAVSFRFWQWTNIQP